MKRWTWRLLSFLLTCIVLGSCNTQESSVLDPKFDTEEYLPQFDMQNEFSFINVACETEDTIYYMMYMAERLIHYYNKDTGEGGILCGKPECTHKEDSCNAYAIEAGGLNIYDGRIWFITWNPSAAGSILYAMDLDGTNREKIQSLSYQGGGNTKIHLHRGYVYIGSVQSEVTEGKSSYHLTITRQEIGNPTDEPEIIYENRGRMSQLFRYIFKGNKMYGYCQSAEGSGIELTTELFVCDLKKGTTEVLSRWDSTSIYPSGIWINEDDVYVVESDTLGDENHLETMTSLIWVWKYNLKEKKIEKCLEIEHPQIGGMWEIGPEMRMGAADQLMQEKSYLFTIMDDQGIILREYSIKEDMAGRELDGSLTYGMTEKGLLCSVTWRLEQTKKEDPVSLEEIWWIPIEDSKEVEKLAEYYKYNLM